MKTVQRGVPGKRMVTQRRGEAGSRLHPALRFQRVACAACLSLLALLLLASGAAVASQNRYLLVDQSSDSDSRGFSLRLENQTDGSAICTLATLKLVLALGDGSSWHYLASPPGGWQTGHEYVARAVVSESRMQLVLDGSSVASDAARALAPSGQAEVAGVQQGWASDATDYAVAPISMQVTTGSGVALSDRYAPRSAQQLLLGSQTGQRYASLSLPSGSSFTVESIFRLLQLPQDLSRLGPAFDATGQAIAARWPGQSITDADLRRDKAVETRRLAAWLSQSDSSYDAYGGWRNAGWHEQPAGVFRVAKRDGKWWLITPDGNPCFYKGIDTAPSPKWETTPITGRESLFAALPPRSGPTADAWGSNAWGSDPGTDSVAFCAVNLFHKYGADWQTALARTTTQRLSAWGFSGMGKWSQPLAGVPSWPVLNRAGVPTLAGHPDPFDPTVQAALHDALAKQITPMLADKTVVAWSLGNEYDEIITAQEIKSIVGMGAGVPAKRALLDDALDTLYSGDLTRLAVAWSIAPAPASRVALYAATPTSVPDADIEKMRVFYATHYYALIYKTVKTIDPHHLYAGFWIVPGWWQSDSDWTSIAANCDVIGYDRYSFQFADDKLAALMRASNKPVFCGEFSFPPIYGGARGFGLYDQAWSQNDADAGRWYAKTIRAAAANPYCVGVGWFQYRDEPQSGRGPGHGPALIYGEHYAFGAVTIADQPKWDLITAMRTANRSADKLRAWR